MRIYTHLSSGSALFPSWKSDLTLRFNASRFVAPHANTSCCKLSLCPQQPCPHVRPWPVMPRLTRPLEAPCVPHSRPLLCISVQAALSAGLPKTLIHPEDLHEGDLPWSLLQLGHKDTVFACRCPLWTLTPWCVPLGCERPRGRSCFLSSHIGRIPRLSPSQPNFLNKPAIPPPGWATMHFK